MRFTNNDICGSCVQDTISFEVEVLSFCTIAGPVITSQGGLVKELRVTKVFLCEMIIHTIALQPAVAKSNASARCAYDVTNVVVLRYCQPAKLQFVLTITKRK